MYLISVRITFVRLTSYCIDVKPAKFPLSHFSRNEGKVKHESINFGVFFHWDSNKCEWLECCHVITLS